MRFAISLLCIIALASVIGTVIKQGEPYNAYVNQFGPFWADVFEKIGVYSIYSSPIFLLIMAFLVLSTTLCMIRNTPRIIQDMRSWREHVRERSLENFHHRHTWQDGRPLPQLAQALSQKLGENGYRSRTLEKGRDILLVAKKGAANRLGYIFAHAAIVIICLGGLLDSGLPIRLQEILFHKTPYSGTGLISDVPQNSRLSANNPSFRGNMMIPEGSVGDAAILVRDNGLLIQDLPFSLRLKKFVIDFYSTGMPKLFASQVELIDHQTGKTLDATIEVNHPLVYKGIAIYQSSFEDGGSRLQLQGYPMTGISSAPFALKGVVGNSTPLAAEPGYTVEWTGFRLFNIENMGQQLPGQQTGLEQRLSTTLGKQLGAAAKPDQHKDFKNLGPSVEYKVRDATGQAREYMNFMMPVDIDGQRVFVSGMRTTPDAPYCYMRIPADDHGSVADWMRLRSTLMQPTLRAEAARRYAQGVALNPGEDTARLRRELQNTAQKTLDVFAGADGEGGYVGVTRFLEKLPKAEQEKAADIFINIMNGSFWDLWQILREQAGEKPQAITEANRRFLQQTIEALSDSFFYGAPVYLNLTGFEQVQASVFQMTRSPGKTWVYIGCLLLVLGVFAMLYIRDRRVWIWLKADDARSSVLLVARTQRRTLDFDREFEALKNRLQS